MDIVLSKNMKEHLNALRELVIKYFFKCENEREIAQKVLMARNTVHSKYKSDENMWTRGRKLPL